MRTSCIVGIGWLVVALVASAVWAAPPKDAKPEQKAAPVTQPAKTPPPAKTASRNNPEHMVVVEVRAPGDRDHAESNRIEKALNEPTEIAFIEAPLCDVIDFIKKRHQIEIQLDNKAFEEAGVALDTQITRNLKGITLRSALRLILRDLDLTYVIRDEVLLITTVSNAETILTTRVYAVGDLLSSAGDDTLESNPAHDLITAIEKTIDITSWNEVGGPGSICYLPVAQSLVISQTFGIHEEIYGLLAAMREVRTVTGLKAGAQSAASADPDKVFVVTYFLKPSAASEQAVKILGQDEKAAPQSSAGTVAKRSLADDLARAVPEVIEPSSWKNNGGGGTIESIGVGVVVRQTRRMQHEVLRFLQSFGVSGAPVEIGVDGPLTSGGGSF